MRRRQHAALAGGDGLVGVEREAGGVAVATTDQAAVDHRRERVGRVLDHRQVVEPRQLRNLLHRSGPAAVVHGDDGPRVLPDQAFHVLRVDREVIWPAVGQNGRGSDGVDHLGGGGKGHRRDDDLISVADAERDQRQVESRRARIQGHGVLGSDRVRKSLLEVSRLGPGCQPTRLEDRSDRVDFGRPDVGPGERNIVHLHTPS